MKCLSCSEASGPGGTRFGIREAVGVCQICGGGVCLEHAARGPAPEDRLICPRHVHLTSSVA